jgi:hypothetical protein
MDIVSTNPVKTLSVEELHKFMEAINKNFSVVTIKGEIKEDLHTRWWDLNEQCLKYAYWNHERITKDYPKMENRSYGDIIKIMIKEELETR